MCVCVCAGTLRTTSDNSNEIASLNQCFTVPIPAHLEHTLKDTCNKDKLKCTQFSSNAAKHLYRESRCRGLTQITRHQPYRACIPCVPKLVNYLRKKLIMNQSVVWPLTLLLVTAFACASGAAFPDQLRTDAQRAIDAIPVADRAYFVTFHLAKEAVEQDRLDISVMPGLDRIPTELYAELQHDFQDIPVPAGFGRKLLAWAEREVRSSLQPMFHKARKNDGSLEVCFPNGCVDPNEIGTNCCPF